MTDDLIESCDGDSTIQPVSPQSNTSLHSGSVASVKSPDSIGSSEVGKTAAVPGLQNYELSRTLFTSYKQLGARLEAQLNDIARNIILHYERAVTLLADGEDAAGTPLERFVSGLQQV